MNIVESKEGKGALLIAAYVLLISHPFPSLCPYLFRGKEIKVAY